ncbi:MAG TPA: hypothetical protein VKB19_06030 [Pedobacter sp.]|nr:hypothetical protein [Pedobacter sp.]
MSNRRFFIKSIVEVDENDKITTFQVNASASSLLNQTCNSKIFYSLMKFIRSRFYPYPQ